MLRAPSCSWLEREPGRGVEVWPGSEVGELGQPVQVVFCVLTCMPGPRMFQLQSWKPEVSVLPLGRMVIEQGCSQGVSGG